MVTNTQGGSLWLLFWINVETRETWSDIRPSKEEAQALAVSLWEGSLLAKVDSGAGLTEEENSRGAIVASLPVAEQYQLVRRYEEEDGIIVRLVEVRPIGAGISGHESRVPRRGQNEGGDPGRSHIEGECVSGLPV